MSSAPAPAQAVQSPRPTPRVTTATPPVQRLGRAVLLQGPVLLEVRHLLALGARERQRRDALAPSPGLRHLLAVLSEAVAEDGAMTPPRHGDVAAGAGPGDSGVERVEEITTDEAAAILALGRRQVQRLAPSIGSRKVPGGALAFDRGAVLAYAAQRLERENVYG